MRTALTQGSRGRSGRNHDERTYAGDFHAPVPVSELYTMDNQAVIALGRNIFAWAGADGPRLARLALVLLVPSVVAGQALKLFKTLPGANTAR